MIRKGKRARFVRAAMALAIGGSAFQLSGCDPAVRDVLLVGLQDTTQSLSAALIDAFFLTLQDDGSGSSSGISTTVP